MELPKILIDSVAEGNAILFLGAGASIGAKHSSGRKVPSGQELSDLIAEKYLGPAYKGKPLNSVSDLAISESSLFDVQNFIASIFSEFSPADFHKQIPTFSWRSIYTTNYDLIIERSYAPPTPSVQELVTFLKNGESIERKIKARKSVVYSKLHGCISITNDDNLPLILTPDQYISHRVNRSRLYERLITESIEFPIIFVGFSLSDPDIRAIILEVDKSVGDRPRSFAIGKYITSEEIRLWERKKITGIPGTFEDLLSELNKAISSSTRSLATIKDTYEHPIVSKFKTVDTKLTSGLKFFLDVDVDYVHKSIATETSDPKLFYKGYFTGWEPIVNAYDVKRRISDDIISDVFLTSESDRLSKQDLYLIKGQAGSGKTVTLKRVAWEAATVFDKICLYYKGDIPPEYSPIYELHNLCKDRIFLFVDKLDDHFLSIVRMINRAKDDKVPLTIISTIRTNEWHDVYSTVFPYVSDIYQLSYLNDTEIDGLLQLLEKHGSLYHLEDLPFDKRKAELTKRLGRELLVALYEATLGEPFEKIIKDEYDSIPSESAKSLYLTISVLHRMGVKPRAGLISRVHDISFTKFKDNFFQPLEMIVFSEMNKKIRDYEYRTRHEYIANMVFEQILTSEQKRFDEYVRIISFLDIDYESDRNAFMGILNAKNLLRLFPNVQFIRKLYDVAEERAKENASLYQQRAIFEMNSDSGSIEQAEKYLITAQKKAPQNKAISHSLAELSLRKAEKAKTDIERQKYLKDSQDLATEINKTRDKTPHATHTLVKINLMRLSNAINANDAIQIENWSKETEREIANAKQIFPEESIILQSESDFNSLLKNKPKAIEALESAFKINKHTPHLAIRLVNLFEDAGKLDLAKTVIEEALENNPYDKDLNFRYAMYLNRYEEDNHGKMKSYLRKSFTQGDSRYAAQYWFARCLYLLNEIPESLNVFSSLERTNINLLLKREPRGIVNENGSEKIFSGKIEHVDLNFAFLIRDGQADKIFFYRYGNTQITWEKLKIGMRIRFNLCFTYKGPIAINVNPE